MFINSKINYLNLFFMQRRYMYAKDLIMDPINLLYIRLSIVFISSLLVLMTFAFKKTVHLIYIVKFTSKYLFIISTLLSFLNSWRNCTNVSFFISDIDIFYFFSFSGQRLIHFNSIFSTVLLFTWLIILIAHLFFILLFFLRYYFVYFI